MNEREQRWIDGRADLTTACKCALSDLLAMYIGSGLDTAGKKSVVQLYDAMVNSGVSGMYDYAEQVQEVREYLSENGDE